MISNKFGQTQLSPLFFPRFKAPTTEEKPDSSLLLIFPSFHLQQHLSHDFRPCTFFRLITENIMYLKYVPHSHSLEIPPLPTPQRTLPLQTDNDTN
ncbi:hypothetical protein VNO77_12244 [Canavalia gladiata]|uniref:Uncharacterized protein n=1 Tax=Canavalia gladiata TaxID=3824 RepID=A0AAN9QPM0_CANGL